MKLIHWHHPVCFQAVIKPNLTWHYLHNVVSYITLARLVFTDIELVVRCFILNERHTELNELISIGMHSGVQAGSARVQGPRGHLDSVPLL